MPRPSLRKPGDAVVEAAAAWSGGCWPAAPPWTSPAPCSLVLPPTTGTAEPAADCPVDLVTAPRETPVRHALDLARLRGGFNSAAVLSAL
ncbi:hypothetical protein ACWEWG_32020 [Streptomyces sp. NPDC003758]